MSVLEIERAIKPLSPKEKLHIINFITHDMLQTEEFDELFVKETGQSISGGDISHRKTLLDLRGSVPVSEPQNFEAIRRRVVQIRSKERVHHGT